VAVLGVIAVTVFENALDKRLSAVKVSPAAEHAVRQASDQLAAAAVPKDVSPAERRALDGAIDQSFIGSFRVVMLSAAALALGGALCAWLMIERDNSS
jgi:hypothetical protein